MLYAELNLHISFISMHQLQRIWNHVYEDHTHNTYTVLLISFTYLFTMSKSSKPENQSRSRTPLIANPQRTVNGHFINNLYGGNTGVFEGYFIHRLT